MDKAARLFYKNNTYSHNCHTNQLPVRAKPIPAPAQGNGL